MSRHAFFDPVHPHDKVVLIIDEAEIVPAGKEHFRYWTGVEHPDCSRLAEVSPHLDAFYCVECRFNGRISGAWFMGKWVRASVRKADA